MGSKRSAGSGDKPDNVFYTTSAREYRVVRLDTALVVSSSDGSLLREKFEGDKLPTSDRSTPGRQ